MKKTLRRLLTLTVITLMIFNHSFNVFADEYKEKKGYVNDYYVVIRTGPSTSYDPVMKDGNWCYYEYKQEVTVIGEENDSSGNLWYKVRFQLNGEETEQWIFGTYVTITEGYEEEPAPPEEEPEEIIAYIIDYSVRIRTGPGTEYSQFRINGEIQYFEYGQEVVIVGQDYDTDGDLWYKVRFTIGGVEYVQWVYSKYAQVKVNNEQTKEYKQEMIDIGFPEDYADKLAQLHYLHPTWNFVPMKTGIEWQTVLNNESRLGYSLIDGNNLCYRSVAEGAFDVKTQSFIPWDGYNWYCANKKTVAYFLDPRNYLNEINIFGFLSLAFKENQTADVVQKVINGTFMGGTEKISGMTYAEIFYEAGKQSGDSPIYLAVLARQEQGTSGSRAITGESFTYNGKTYSNLYNFFNIGATSGTDNWKKGLIWANGGESGSNTSYGRPWNTPYKAIVGGAIWIGEDYINFGQDTMYLHKFNVTENMTFGHQYMTNIRSAYSESNTMYDTYYQAGCLDQELTFTIPVYNNMPEKTELPTTYWLPQTLEEQRNYNEDMPDPTIEPDPEPEQPIPEDPEPQPDPQPEDPQPEEPIEYNGDLIADLNLKNSDGYLTGFTLGETVGGLREKVVAINEKATIAVINTSQKEMESEAVIGSGMHLEITDASGKSIYTIILKGDVNGDGKINLQDLLMVKKDILGMAKIEGFGVEAAVVNDNDKVNLQSYMVIKRHILGLQAITQ